MDFVTAYKKSMVIAVKIFLLLFLFVWLFPFVPPLWSYLYSVFVVVGYYLVRYDDND